MSGSKRKPMSQQQRARIKTWLAAIAIVVLHEEFIAKEEAS